MDFRRSGQLDERRRRVLMDEIASPSDADNPNAASAVGGSAKGPVRAYHEAVLSLAFTLATGKQVVSTSLAAGSTLTWIAVYGLVLGALGLRLIFEIWSSRLSLTALVLAGFLYFNAALLQLETLKFPATLIEG